MSMSRKRLPASGPNRHGEGALGLGTFLLVVLAASTANAENKADERTARKACLTGDYERGVSVLADLFLNTKDPLYIFNQGRCFEQNQQYRDAIGRFEEYLRTTEDHKGQDANRADAQKHITQCKRQLAQDTQPKTTDTVSPATPPAPPPALPTSTVGPAEAPVPAPAPAAAPVEAPAQASDGQSGGRGWRMAGIITASVGVAALVGGVLLNVKVNSMASDMEGPGKYSDGRESDRKSYQTLGWVAYGVGSACIASGVALYLMGRGAFGNSSVALVPNPGPDYAGAMLAGEF